MANKKLSKEEAEGVEKVEEVSEEKQKFLELIEVYKKQNPVKFELKRAELEKRLNLIK